MVGGGYCTKFVTARNTCSIRSCDYSDLCIQRLLEKVHYKIYKLIKYMYVFIGVEIKIGLCSGKGKGELYCLQRPVVEYGYMCEAHIVNKAIARLIILQ